MNNQMIQHGGNLRQAARLYDTPLEDWMDLSTGINPKPWQPPEIPTVVWHRLPETDDHLLVAAQKYYACHDLLAISGSQAAIQSLPFCREQSNVGIVSPCYKEHAYWWEAAGHNIVTLSPEDIDFFIPRLSVLVLVNPNNPDGRKYTIAQLLAWHHQLMQYNGWLIVDEAFIDSTPQQSLLSHIKIMPKGLVVLRSIGKFFGLAGIRLGFLAAEPQLLEQVARWQGAWAVSHPARWLGVLALQDLKWQQQASVFLADQSEKLYQVLAKYFPNIQKSNYFCYFQHPDAMQIKDQLARDGVWVRYFENPTAIRIGLPKNNTELQKLTTIFSNTFISLQ